ncbi:MAG: prolyl oligopeptidase family serine peptidase [Deltaproteobacteria bacterium]|nr:prolyl oligopeptidase family serine peptidase [Deltaproteobacteria bacterium]
MGERGSDLEQIKKNGPLCRVVKDGEHFPFIIATPQCPAGAWWDSWKLIELVKHLVSKYQVDRHRIYLTGVSMGGSGVLKLASEYPEYFAAVAAVCPFFTPLDPVTLAHTPTWFFHGAKDEVVPATDSERMVNWIKSVTTNQKVRFTVFPNLGHNCWREVYGNQELYTWLLTHSRN